MWKLAPNPGLLDAQKAAKRDYSCSLRVRAPERPPEPVEPRTATPASR